MGTTLLEPVTLLLALVALLQIALITVVIYGAKNIGAKLSEQFEQTRATLGEQIAASVEPHLIQLAPTSEDLVGVAIEIWRLKQRLKDATKNIPENASISITKSLEKLNRYIDSYDIEVVDLTEQAYNKGLGVDVLDVVKGEKEGVSVIKETIEPMVKIRGQVVKRAKVIIME